MSIQRFLLLPVFAYVGWLVLAYEYHFLDGVNLLFHEAGHVFLGFFGQTLHFLGGTIGQLFFPIACGVHFLQSGKRVETCLMGVWLAESLMNTARYLGDAQAQVLPLVGGHIHDWNWLLRRFGMLEHCEAIATGLHGLAALLAVASAIAAWQAAAPEDAFSVATDSGWWRPRRSARGLAQTPPPSSSVAADPGSAERAAAIDPSPNTSNPTRIPNAPS